VFCRNIMTQTLIHSLTHTQTQILLTNDKEKTCDDTSDVVLRMAYDKIYLLEKRVDEMQMALSGKTNSAFVFVKPHAAGKDGEKVEALVAQKLKESGIRVTGHGVITAESIDKNMFIDKHYGAIASKAVVLKPSELNVPAKGKAQFEKMFGMSWEDAIAQGKVYNAKDACEKLSCDGAGLEKKWRKLTRGKDLIKFGGGFYCGQLEEGIFVMNGFYMSMRSAYCAPGKQIHYYTVSWPTDTLSWADFRGKVLGTLRTTTNKNSNNRPPITLQKSYNILIYRCDKSQRSSERFDSKRNFGKLQGSWTRC